MPRQLTDFTHAYEHITVQDEPGPGGANHHYTIGVEGSGTGLTTQIQFQKGPIQEVGANGITNEALIAIVLDRLRGFQRGAYACRENAIAITKLEEAQLWQAKRTFDRAARGVEGTSTV